jgi:hypothetical protein
MAFSNISEQALGKFLTISFDQGIRNQLSEDFRDFEQVKMYRVGDPNGRELRYSTKTGYGPSAAQYRNPNFTKNFPKAQRISQGEHIAVFKELDLTIEIEYNLWNRARKGDEKYAEPLAEELASKNIVGKRRVAADWYLDGTGCLGKGDSAADQTDLANGNIKLVLDTSDGAPGFVGNFEYGDVLIAATETGTAQEPEDGGAQPIPSFYGWLVVERKRKTDTVTLQAVDEEYAPVTTVAQSNIDATSYLYRVGQPTIPDRTDIADYGSATETFVGLAGMVADDGRVTNGLTMSGVTSSTIVDAGGAELDVEFIEEALNELKIRCGENAYTYKKMCQAPETHTQFVRGRETDRRFNAVTDSVRGTKVFGYQHRNDFVEAYASEFVPKDAIYMLPEAKNGSKVFECHTTDFETVSANDSGQFHLKPGSGGGHERVIVTYMEAMGQFICKHPAAVGKIKNFVYGTP